MKSCNVCMSSKFVIIEDEVRCSRFRKVIGFLKEKVTKRKVIDDE